MQIPHSPITRILIVDDEMALLKALCHTLHDSGYETTGFSTGQEALVALQETTFDLILTDLMMPEMDGIALLRAAQEIDHHLVGIVMTGHATIDTAVAAMKAGAFDYILKPFNLRVAIPALSRALEMRRLRLDNEVLERQVQIRNTALEAANRELETFTSSIAHDLHTPTRHIGGYAQMVLDECSGQLSTTALRRLNIVVQSAERLGQLIADLLAFSRLARSEAQFDFVDLSALVTQVQLELEPEIKDRAIVWKVAELPTVQADKSMLRQAIYNLLTNAIKYTRGRTPAEIEVGSRVEGQELVCFFRDNGVGFDMQYVSKLFGIFQRLHRTEEFEGSGVGLSIVQRIVQRHGGRIWAEAEVNKGATFSFTLPLHR